MFVHAFFSKILQFLTSKGLTQHRRNVNPYRPGIDFSRQILTSKVDPRTESVKMFIMAVDPYHETFIIIKKCKQPFGLYGFYKYMSVVSVAEDGFGLIYLVCLETTRHKLLFF